MKRKIMLAVYGVLVLCALTGCQLAQENLGANEDKLIGVLVTTEPLGLFDFDGYLSDNASFQGGELTLNGNTEAYQGRLYAALITKTLTDEETGEKTDTNEYVFENIEGTGYFSPTVPATDESENYIAPVQDEGISDGHRNFNFGEEENSLTMEGTIYATPMSENQTYYCNPVYQSADGSVYTISEYGGFMVSDESYSEGPVITQTLDASTTVTENGKAMTESTSIKISISIMFAPEKIIVMQMDENNELLSRMEYAPDMMPEDVMPEADTAYLIVETIKRDDTGSLKSSCEIYDRDAESFATFSVRADGVCIKHWTQLKWE